MKKIIVMLLCVFSLANAYYPTLVDAKTYLKDYGLSSCLIKNWSSNINIARIIDARMDVIEFGWTIQYYLKITGFKEIKKIEKTIDSFVLEYLSKPENQRAPNKQGYRVYMLECMRMYHSQEYDQAIEKIFNNKKYYDAKK